MSHRCYNRLTIVGRQVDLKVFDKNTRWPKKFATHYPDLLECSPTRHVWQFETGAPPLEPLQRLSTAIHCSPSSWIMTGSAARDWSRRRTVGSPAIRSVTETNINHAGPGMQQCFSGPVSI